ncbi:hypothetical protein [Sulfuricella denitrificans]|nr:hypothetical protein [Sulfuricella denitrificans]
MTNFWSDILANWDALAKGEEITQDVSTLENPAILEQLKQVVK